MTDTKTEMPKSYAAIYIKQFDSGDTVHLETAVVKDGKLQITYQAKVHSERVVPAEQLAEVLRRAVEALLAARAATLEEKC